jgi:PAS domain S-box-containing protein
MYHAVKQLFRLPVLILFVPRAAISQFVSTCMILIFLAQQLLHALMAAWFPSRNVFPPSSISINNSANKRQEIEVVMQHDFEQFIDPTATSLDPPMPPAPLGKGTPEQGTGHFWFVRFWKWLRSWFRTATFSPDFLPAPWSSPAFGYLVAILSQIAVVVAVTLLLQSFPAFSFPESFFLLVILLVALGWGAGPSFVATFICAALIIALIIPPYHSLALAHEENAFGVFLLLIVGLIISVLTSRIQRISLSALALSRRQEAIIEAIPDSLIIYDTSGKVVSFNQAARKNLPPEHQALAVSDMADSIQLRTLNNEVLPLDAYPFFRALRGENVTNAELRYRLLGNQQEQERFVSVSAAPLPVTNTKDIERVIVITHDISPLYHVEREARERAQQLQTIFEAIADALFILYPDGSPAQMNEAARALLDLPPGSVLDITHGLPFDLLDEQGEVLSHDRWPQNLLFQGERLHGATTPDVLLRTHSGKTSYLNISGAPLYDSDGQIRAAVLVCRDVTERHHLEHRIRASLDALIQMAQVMVQGTEPDALSPEEGSSFASRKVMHRLAELTREVLGCQRLGITGVEPETELLRPLAVVGLSPELEQQWWQEQEAQEVHLSDNPDPAMLEQFLAEEIMLIDLTQPPYNSQPNPYGIRQMLVAPLILGTRILGILSLDYGGLDHFYTADELALTKAVARLAAFIIERDRLLAETALARADALAALETTRRMDEFIGIASHEMKTPLTSVKGNVQLAQYRLKRMLQRLPAEDESNRSNLEELNMLLSRAERQANVQNRLVSDLLDVSRIAAAKLEMHFAPTDLTQTVSEAVENQRLASVHRTIWLYPSAQSIPVLADADRISQVVSNYLSNALKYSTTESPVEVSLTIEGNHARVSVRDQGSGLSLEEQELIWERFYRVPGIKVSSGSGIGLGLGLYICRTIIEQHQGSVGVESTPGQGSTFWFRLPIAA